MEKVTRSQNYFLVSKTVLKVLAVKLKFSSVVVVLLVFCWLNLQVQDVKSTLLRWKKNSMAPKNAIC